MADIKLGNNTYEGVEAVKLDTTDGGTVTFESVTSTQSKVVDIKKLIADGAPQYGTTYKLVKVADYIPFGDWVYNIEVAGSKEDYKCLSSVYECYGTDEYMTFTDVVDNPIRFVYVGKNGVSNSTNGITEPGLYASVGLYYVKLPEIASFVDWYTILNRPFGTFDGHVLRCVDYDRDVEGATKTTQVDGVSTSIEYKKFGNVPVYMEMADFIGCEMLLSDDTIVTLTEDNFRNIYHGENAYGDIVDVYEMENLLLITDLNYYNYVNVDDTTTISMERVGGVFTSNHTGVYVKELRCKPYKKTIDSEYVPVIHSDMTETDPTKPAYVENNILYVAGTDKEAVYSGTVQELSELELIAGSTYTVNIAGDYPEYEVVAQLYEESGVVAVYIGDLGLAFNDAATEGSSTPFCVLTDNSMFAMAVLANPETGEAVFDDTVITISCAVRTHKIDQKYIPALDSITLNGADGKQYKVTVDASGSLAVTAIE